MNNKIIYVTTLVNTTVNNTPADTYYEINLKKLSSYNGIKVVITPSEIIYKLKTKFYNDNNMFFIEFPNTINSSTNPFYFIKLAKDYIIKKQNNNNYEFYFWIDINSIEKETNLTTYTNAIKNSLSNLPKLYFIKNKNADIYSDTFAIHKYLIETSNILFNELAQQPNSKDYKEILLNMLSQINPIVNYSFMSINSINSSIVKNITQLKGKFDFVKYFDKYKNRYIDPQEFNDPLKVTYFLPNNINWNFLILNNYPIMNLVSSLKYYFMSNKKYNFCLYSNHKNKDSILEFSNILTTKKHNVDIIDNINIKTIENSNFDFLLIDLDNLYDNLTENSLLIKYLHKYVKVVAINIDNRFLLRKEKWTEEFRIKFNKLVLICKIDNLFVISKTKKQTEFLKNNDISEGKIIYLPNGVDYESFNYYAKPSRTKSLFIGKDIYECYEDKIYDIQKNNYSDEDLLENLSDHPNIILLSEAEIDPKIIKQSLCLGLGVVMSENVNCDLDLNNSFISIISNNKLDDINYIKHIIEQNKLFSLNCREEIKNYGCYFSWEYIVEKFIEQFHVVYKLITPFVVENY